MSTCVTYSKLYIGQSCFLYKITVLSQYVFSAVLIIHTWAARLTCLRWATSWQINASVTHSATVPYSHLPELFRLVSWQHVALQVNWVAQIFCQALAKRKAVHCHFEYRGSISVGTTMACNLSGRKRKINYFHLLRECFTGFLEPFLASNKVLHKSLSTRSILKIHS